MPRLHVVVLAHGSHGSPSQMQQLVSFLERSTELVTKSNDTLPLCLVNLHLAKQPGESTDDGIVVCGQRAIREVLDAVRSRLQQLQLPSSYCEPSSPLNLNLRLSAAGFSLGGLVLREILPALFEDLEALPEVQSVAGHVLVTLGTPHLGCAQMPNPLKRRVAYLLARYGYSLTYSDLLLNTNVLSERLLSPRHLQALRRIPEKFLFAAIGDELVPLPSASLTFSPGKVQPDRAGVSPASRPLYCACMVDVSKDICQLATLPCASHSQERRMAMLLSRDGGAVGSWFSYLIDPRILFWAHYAHQGHQLSTTAFCRGAWGAYMKPHRALVCAEPANQPHCFGSISRHVAHLILRK